MSAVIVLSSVLNLVASALLTLVAFTASGRGSVRRHFLIFQFCITTWALFYFFWQLANTSLMAYLSCQGLIIPATFIPVTFYHLCLKLAERKETLLLWFGYGLAFAALATTPFGGLVAGVSPKLDFKYWPDAGPFLYLVIAIFMIYAPLSTLTLLRGSKEHIGFRSSQMRFVLVSSAIGFFGGFTNFPLWYDIKLPPYGNLIVFVYLLMVGYGVYNRRISGIYVDVFKALIYLLLAASFSMFYVLGRAVFAMVLREDIPQSTYWVHAVVAFVLSLLLFWAIPRARAWMEDVLEIIFRKDRVNALAALSELPTRLSNLSDIESIAEVISDSIEEILDVHGVGVFWLEPFGSSYKKIYSTSGFPSSPDDGEIALDGSLITRLSEHPECIHLDHVDEGESEVFYAELKRLKNETGVEVVVPVFASKEIYGLIFLQARKQAQLWSEEEMNALFNAGAQIGLNVRVRDFERRSSEVDKLVALGTMAAGLSHEIRNPLVSVQTLGSLLSSEKPLDRMPEDFRKVLVRDIHRIESIVDGVAAFSMNENARKSVVQIEEIVHSSIQLFSSDNKLENGFIHFDSGPAEKIEVLGNLDQLVQVFINLLDNAWHATHESDGSRIEINIRLYSKMRSQWIEVSVSDNGKGIPPSVAGRIFDPFITSKDTGSREKKQGMGLGLAISKRIIENHGGQISVSESDLGGAKFTVLLKVFDPSNE